MPPPSLQFPHTQAERALPRRIISFSLFPLLPGPRVPKLPTEAQGGPNQVNPGVLGPSWQDRSWSCVLSKGRRDLLLLVPHEDDGSFWSLTPNGVMGLITEARSSQLCLVPMKCKPTWVCPSGNTLRVWLWAALWSKS